jgi:hypothetical protein
MGVEVEAESDGPPVGKELRMNSSAVAGVRLIGAASSA